MRTGSPLLRVIGLLLVIWLASSRIAGAQVAPSGFFTDPVLVLRVGGHQAPVRAMLFTPGGTQLLTGGMDKVIHVWNIDVNRSGPARTLQPPYWRGARGQVNAMALSPRDDGGNQRILAVAGSGVLATQGEILLFRYPGEFLNGTGEIVGQLPSTAADGTLGPGHSGVVNALAFTPDGRFLVSASNDKTIRIWDVDARRQVAVLNDAKAEINCLSLFANGTRLVSAGNEGVVRLHDLSVKERPKLLSQYPKVGRNPPFPVDLQINAIAASPDDRWIVAGSEKGTVARFKSDLIDEPSAIQVNNKLRNLPVQALSISPDSSRLAIGLVTANLADEGAEIPSVTSQVSIRSLNDGQLIEALPVLPNLISALAFSSDGNRLAYSGGDARSIFLKDFGAGAPVVPDEIRGYGSSVWDVGFRADGQAIRFARRRPAVAGQGTDYESFNLRGRFFFNPEPNEPAYRHATSVEAGWTITPVDQYSFNFTNALRQGWRRSLDPINERRWWAYTVIPAGPGHPQPVAAVAADAGIVLWNLVNGLKTRVFNGHSGPVYAIASSVDGKWLVTGSADQTVRLWPLEGCDTIPKFGATFQRQANGSWVVDSVVPGGFADGISLKKGHVVEKLFLGKDGPAEAVEIATELPRLDAVSPSWMITIVARMNGDVNQPLFQAATTKRDSPGLSLFPGVDHRWVFWTPRGYYDSSADGDRKFLGWLTNRGTVAQLLAGSFDSIDKFEARFRQPKAPRPNVIDRLLDTANPLQAEAVAAMANPAQPPPDPVTSRLAALEITPVSPVPGDRPLVAAQPTIPLRYRALAMAGAAGISRLWVEANGRIVADLRTPNAPAVRAIEGQRAIPIGFERDVRVSLVSVDERGVRRDQPIDIANQAPPIVARSSQLEIIAIAAEEFGDRRLPRIAYAEDDAQDLAKFLGEKLVDPATGKRFATNQIRVQKFLGGHWKRDSVGESLRTLRRSLGDSSNGSTDVVALVVESHYLEASSLKLFTTAEANLGPFEPPSIKATDLAESLADLTRSGTRVIVIIDAVHELKTPGWDNDIQEWIRQLQRQSSVIAFIAADHGPSSANGDGHRVFAQAILDVLKAKSNSRLRKPGGPLSLFDFQRTVTDSVLQQTVRKQHAQCYLPDSISPQVPFLDDSPR